VASQAFSVISEGVSTNPDVRVRIEAVVRRIGCPEGASEPCVVAWSQS
jgi:hypothetical protein